MRRGERICKFRVKGPFRRAEDIVVTVDPTAEIQHSAGEGQRARGADAHGGAIVIPCDAGAFGISLDAGRCRWSIAEFDDKLGICAEVAGGHVHAILQLPVVDDCCGAGHGELAELLARLDFRENLARTTCRGGGRTRHAETPWHVADGESRVCGEILDRTIDFHDNRAVFLDPVFADGRLGIS